MNSEDKKRIRALKGNDKCCDCFAPNPTWVSLSHATLICMECSGRHRGLGVHISFVRSIDLDSFSETDVKKLEAGGNDNFRQFVSDHGGSSLLAPVPTSTTANSGASSGTTVRERYESDAARLYREVMKARVEGKPEPSMDDLPKQSSQQKPKLNCQDPSEIKGGVGLGATTNATSASGKAINSFPISSTEPFPSVITRFIGGFKYWTYRLVALPLRNNRRLAVSLVALYTMNKMAEKSYLPTGTTNQEGINSSMMQTIVALSSKVFTTIMVSTTSSLLTLSAFSIHWFNVHRQTAFKSAINALQDRILNARAKRNPLYDLYFPPNTSIGSKITKGVIFFPDILVDKTAYATVMGELSDAGILVAVVNHDPLRIPTQMTAGGKPISSATTVLRIAFEIQKLLGMQVDEWVLMGHGEGACAVTDVIRNAPAAIQGPNGKLKKPRCVLWSPTSFLHNLRHISVSVLVVNTADGVMASGNVVSNMLPPTRNDCPTMHYVIGGGSHSGFAHYGPGTFKRENPHRTKTLEEQQKEVRDLSVDFILQKQAR